MSSKKYLLYDNIVRGAGIGHIHACINYAVQLSMEKKLTLMIGEVKTGHEMNRFEHHILGLSNCNVDVDSFLKHHADETMYIKRGKQHPSYNKYVNTRHWFIERFIDNIDNINWKNLLDSDSNTTNISITIRRGDITLDGPTGGHFYRTHETSVYKKLLEQVIHDYNITNFRLLIFSDVSPDHHSGEFVDKYNNKEDIFDTFKEYTDNIIYSPSYQSEDTYQKTVDTFMNIYHSDYMIGSASGMSVTLADCYRDMNPSILTSNHTHVKYFYK